MEAAELVELEEKLAAAEGRLLDVLRREREEATRVARQRSTLPRRTARRSLVPGQGRGGEEEGKEEEEKEEEDETQEEVAGGRYFYAPWYLPVTCLTLVLPEEYVCRFFWEITSGRFPYSTPVGSTVVTCCVRLQRAVVPASCPRCRWQFWGNFAWLVSRRTEFFVSSLSVAVLRVYAGLVSRRTVFLVSSSMPRSFDSGYMFTSVYRGFGVYFLLREGGLGPCLSLCNDRCPWSLVMPRSLSTTVVWLVLLVLTHFALCWLSRCVSLIVDRPKDFGCGGGDFVRCRGPDSSYRLEVPQLQLIFKDVDFPVVAQRLSHGSRLFS